MLGPIFSIELMTAGRRARFVALRGIYAGFLLATLCISYSSFTDFDYNSATRGRANFAQGFFQLFAWVQLGAVLVLGPGLTAGTIAQERERRTLDYLLASDLRSGEIILGKFTARAMSVAWLIAAGMPVMACATLMGGIEGWNLFLVFVAAMGTLLMVSAASLAVSVKARRARDAIVGAYLLIACWLVAAPAATMLLYATLPAATGLWGGVLYDWLAATIETARWMLLAPNPAVALVDLFKLRPVGISLDSFGEVFSPWRTVGRMVAAQAVIVAICLAWSAWTVRRAHRKGQSESKRPKARAWRLLRPNLFEPAMLWKEMFAERSGRLGLAASIAKWLIVLVVLGISGYVLVIMYIQFSSFGGGPGRPGFGSVYLYYALTMTSFLACLGLLLAAGRAATLISSEKERDCWLTLISTDLAGRQIVWGKVLGNVWSSRGLLLLLSIVWLPGLLFDISTIVPYAMFMATLLVLLLFVSSLGVLFSLKSVSSMRAIAGVTFLLLVLGGGYWMCCFPVMFTGSGGEGFILFAAPTVPFLLAFPGMVFFNNGPNPHSSEFVLAIMAYWIGLIGYLVAGGSLGGFAANEFDRFAGRIVPRNAGPTPPHRAIATDSGESPFKPSEIAESIPPTFDQD
ncbi:MAG: ABC transporter permease subunit [Pirellulales bacterium]